MLVLGSCLDCKRKQNDVPCNFTVFLVLCGVVSLLSWANSILGESGKALFSCFSFHILFSSVGSCDIVDQVVFVVVGGLFQG